jgi:hypothetical protein
MAKIIYPQEVFDKGENGVVFYKDGIVNDDLRQLGPGILESWRYDFDAGRQIFRAEGQGENEGIIYERRLTKDTYGNPQWSGWMEIPSSEARGVQAIAINAGPLKLPNSEGAIKLEIHPGTINAFTKGETNNLIDQKLNDFQTAHSKFVPWPATDPEGHLTPKQVLEQAFPEGGYTEVVYTVAKIPGSGPDKITTQWIWDISKYGPDGTPVYDWLQVSSGGIKDVFVTWSSFEAHVDNQDIHTTAAKQTLWNEASVRSIENTEALTTKADQTSLDTTNDALAAVQEQSDSTDANLEQLTADVNEHVNDEVRHVTIEDKAYWNNKLDSLPNNEKRVVGQLEQWVPAFEQLELGAEQTTIAFQNTGAISVEKQSFIIAHDWDTDFRNLRLQEAIVEGVELSFASMNTQHLDLTIRTEEVTRHSQIFNSDVGIPVDFWQMGPSPFSILVVELSAPPGVNKPRINGLIVKITYKTATKVIIGDGEHDTPLQLNLIGSGPLLFNGNPVVPAGETVVHWGNIDQNISQQTDLITLVANSTGHLVQVGPDNGKRYNLTRRDVWIPALAQTTGEQDDSREIQTQDVSYVINDGQQVPFPQLPSFFAGLDPTMTLVGIKLRIQYISSAENSGGLYFETDNPVNGRSPIIDGYRAEFEWDIITAPFTKLIARSLNGGSALRQAHQITITAYLTKFTGVEVSLADKTTLIHGTRLDLAPEAAQIDDVTIRTIALSEYFHERVACPAFEWPIAA